MIIYENGYFCKFIEKTSSGKTIGCLPEEV